MSRISISAQSYSRNFEVMLDEKENTELAVEHGVSHTLLYLFDEAMVEDVTVRFSPLLRSGQRECTIQILAECAYDSFVQLPCTKDHMVHIVGTSVCSLLKELFGPVTLTAASIEPSYTESR